MNDEAEAILRADAEKLGITWTQYCDRFGIVGPAQERVIRRHEVPMAK